MREQIDTIPVTEAFETGDECPFCWLERMSEQKSIRYILGPGASYMEPDVRGMTDAKGFCREHTKKMYDFGNALGNALIMQTYMAGLIEEFDREAAGFQPPAPKKLFGKKQPQEENGLLEKQKARQNSCCLCERLEYHMGRYFHTFFVLLREPEFREKVAHSKGFCMRHFARLLELAKTELPNGQREWFYQTVIPLMKENLLRVKGDLDHFVSMFDYRSAGKDWGNAKDAVSRTMQKLQGGYPTDAPYKMNP
jgi:hypothetical protein